MRATVAGLSSFELYGIGLAIRQYSLLVAVALVKAVAQALSTNVVAHSNSFSCLLDMFFDLGLFLNLLFRRASV